MRYSEGFKASIVKKTLDGSGQSPEYVKIVYATI